LSAYTLCLVRASTAADGTSGARLWRRRRPPRQMRRPQPPARTVARPHRRRCAARPYPSHSTGQGSHWQPRSRPLLPAGTILLHRRACVLPRPLAVIMAQSEPHPSFCNVLLGRLPVQPHGLRLVLLHASSMW
jgi:hypothetical protein